MQDIESILITEALRKREASVDIERTNAALVSLAATMAEAPEKLPQALCDVALELCGAETAGISMLRQRPDGEAFFHWEAMAGVFASYVGGTTPRDFSPCGTTLDRGETQLFLYPGRLFTYLDEVSPRIVEGMVVPFYAAGRALGTIWIVSHQEQGQFDAGDVRIMEQLGAFCGAAFHLLSLKEQADAANASLASEARVLSEINQQSQASLQQSGLANLVLQESIHAKDEFVSLVSHELRGPVSNIYGFAKLLVSHSDRLSSADIRQGLETIEEESTRMTRIIEDLLVLARPEDGGPDEEPVDVCDAVRVLIGEHIKLNPNRSIWLEDGGQRPVASANYGYIAQVVRNLVSNAEKYSPGDQPILVLVRQQSNEIVITVEDRGAGIAPEEKEAIFQSFYRSPDAQQQATGIGIGLTVCKRLVEAQGGKIWVEAGAGGGARFCFSLRAYSEA